MALQDKLTSNLLSYPIKYDRKRQSLILFNGVKFGEIKRCFGTFISFTSINYYQIDKKRENSKGVLTVIAI